MSAGSGLSKSEPLAGRRMGEAEQPGMQGLARKAGDLRAGRPVRATAAPGARAIDRIADQRMAEMREMHADLVGPAGQQAALEQRRVIRRSGARPDSASPPACRGSSRDDRHLLAVDARCGRYCRRSRRPAAPARPRQRRCRRGRSGAPRNRATARGAPARSWRRRGGRSCPCRGDARCPAGAPRRCRRGWRRNARAAH